MFYNTEVHLIDRELNEEVFMLPQPPPPYVSVPCMPNFTVAWDGIHTEPELPMITSIEYKLSEKRFSIDKGMWVAVYKQQF